MFQFSCFYLVEFFSYGNVVYKFDCSKYIVGYCIEKKNMNIHVLYGKYDIICHELWGKINRMKQMNILAPILRLCLYSLSFGLTKKLKLKILLK
jgi:hypothetical protein